MKLRDELIPINQRRKVDETLDAAYATLLPYDRPSRLHPEYALIRDINGSGAGVARDLLGKRSWRSAARWLGTTEPDSAEPDPGSKWDGIP